MSLLFFGAVYKSKTHVIPHSIIPAILDVILNISNAENNNNTTVEFSKYNYCWKLSENSYLLRPGWILLKKWRPSWTPS